MSAAEADVTGFLVVDKPEGPTSHDVVARIRRLLGTRRVGHTGTLDPMATGVLVLCIGRATRLARFLAAAEKHYTGRIRLGWETDTLDRTGRPIGAPRPCPDDAARIALAMQQLTGRREQLPPAFSAKRIDGVRAHRIARRGDPRTPPPAVVEVRIFRLVALQDAEVEFEVHCSSGTYVRSLARELGEALGCGGHLTALRRTRSGEFDIDSAWSLDRLEVLAARGAAAEAILPTGSVALGMPAVRAETGAARRLAQGQPLAPGVWSGALPAGAVQCRILGPEGGLLAVADVDPAGGRLLPRVVLVGPSSEGDF